MNILDLVKNSTHCRLLEGVLSCKNCEKSLNSPQKPKSLQNHLMIISGFVEYHRKCIENNSPF